MEQRVSVVVHRPGEIAAIRRERDMFNFRGWRLIAQAPIHRVVMPRAHRWEPGGRAPASHRGKTWMIPSRSSAVLFPSIGDPFASGRPILKGDAIVSERQLPWRATSNVDDPELRLSSRPGNKRQPLTVRRQRGGFNAADIEKTRDVGTRVASQSDVTHERLRDVARTRCLHTDLRRHTVRVYPEERQAKEEPGDAPF